MMPNKKTTVADRIKHLEPCQDALKWAMGYTNPAKAWAECKRGDWMLWLLGTQAGPPESDKRKKLVLCACECARLALKYTKDERVKLCIETAERWANGKATIKELRKARDAAAAAYAAYAAADAAADADAALGHGDDFHRQVVAGLDALRWALPARQILEWLVCRLRADIGKALKREQQAKGELKEAKESRRLRLVELLHQTSQEPNDGFDGRVLLAHRMMSEAVDREWAARRGWVAALMARRRAIDELQTFLAKWTERLPLFEQAK